MNGLKSQFLICVELEHPVEKVERAAVAHQRPVHPREIQILGARPQLHARQEIRLMTSEAPRGLRDEKRDAAVVNVDHRQIVRLRANAEDRTLRIAVPRRRRKRDDRVRAVVLIEIRPVERDARLAHADQKRRSECRCGDPNPT